MKSAAQIPNSSLINLTYEEQLALDGSTFVDLTMGERRSGCKVRQGLAVQGSPPANNDGCNLAGAPEVGDAIQPHDGGRGPRAQVHDGGQARGCRRSGRPGPADSIAAEPGPFCLPALRRMIDNQAATLCAGEGSRWTSLQTGAHHQSERWWQSSRLS